MTPLATIDNLVRLTADKPVDPYLVKAHYAGTLRAWAVRDRYGWAVMARVPIRSGTAVRTVDRYEKLFSDEPTRVLLAGMLTGLARFAATGSTGEGMQLPTR
jgi:hypothetical protein